MKKTLLIVSIFAVVMLVGVPQATAVEPTDSISVNVAVEETGIGLSADQWNIGVVATSTDASSPMFTATNLGTVTEDFNIASGDISPWTCGSSGADEFWMGFDTANTHPGATICGAGQTLASGVAGVVPGPPGTVDFYLHFTAPSSFTVAAPGAIIVTVTATPTP